MTDEFLNEMRFFKEILTELALRSKITIFLDENILQLRSALKDFGYKVVVLKKGTPDEEIWELAQGWCILTQNSKDFISNAPEYDYDVIAIENIKFIDNEPTRKNLTVQKISKAIKQSHITSLKGNFLLTVLDTGEWNLRILGGDDASPK